MWMFMSHTGEMFCILLFTAEVQTAHTSLWGSAGELKAAWIDLRLWKLLKHFYKLQCLIAAN